MITYLSTDHAGLDDTGLDTTDWHRANTANLVYVLKRQTKRFICGTRRWVDCVDSFQQGLASGFGLSFLLPALVPWAIGGVVDHVIAVETRDRNERYGLGVIADLLDEIGSFLDNFIVTILGPFGSVHLVDRNDELFDAKSIGEKSVLACLTIFGDTSFKFTGTSSNDEDCAIGLGSTSDHVLDEVTMSRSVFSALAMFHCIRVSSTIPITVT